MSQAAAALTLKKPDAHKRQRIAQSLRELAGTLAPGDRLPSVPELERHFGVSTSTVEAAVDVLRREGVLIRRRGSGTFVAPRDFSGAAGAARVAAGAEPRETVRGTVAVVAFAQSDYFRSCVDHLTEQAEASHLRLVVHYGHHEAASADTLADALALERLHPAGFLVISYKLLAVAQALSSRGHRAVVMGVPPPDVHPAAPCVYGDHEQGAYLAAKRLLALGHRPERIAYAHVFPSNDSLLGSRRWRGHLRALREAGMDAHAASPLVVGPGALNPYKDDPEKARRFFAAPDAPTGICVWTDQEALGWLTLLRRAGLRVPEDVSVVGYDALPQGERADPTLDTIDPQLDVQVRYALSLLLSDPAGGAPGAAPNAIVTPTLLARGSTAAPPAA